MARRTKVSVGDVADMLSAGREAERRRSAEIRVLVLVAPDAVRSHALAVRDAFTPELASSVVCVRALGSFPDAGSAWDVAVIVAAADAAGATEEAVRVARCGVPVSIVAESALDVRDESIPSAVSALVFVIAATSRQALMDKLGSWVVGAVGEKGLAFAANFPFCRKAKVGELVHSCAAQNAAVGAITLIPGADLPIMCANQTRLALDMAAAFGRPLCVERLAELGAVLGAGFVYRQLARTLVGLAPVLGWAIKGGIGYFGTVTTGGALAARLDPDSPDPVASLRQWLPKGRVRGQGTPSPRTTTTLQALLPHLGTSARRNAHGDAPAYIDLGKDGGR